MIDWLLVGALRDETQPVIDALNDAQPQGRRTVLARLADQSVAVLRCGVGPANALERTRRSVLELSPARVLSFGTCGSLDAQLAIGTVVTADRLCLGSGPWLGVTPVATTKTAVAIVTVDAPVWADTHAGPLRALGARACEMEAAAVLEAAGQQPTQVLKVVSDVVGQSAPPRMLPGGVPHPRDMLAFKRLARRLTKEELVPAIIELVYSTSKA